MTVRRETVDEAARGQTGRAAVHVVVVSIVAPLQTVNYFITTDGAGTGASISIVFVAVVACLALLHDAVAAAGRSASESAVRVEPWFAFLARVQDIVATRRLPTTGEK